jgi:CDP-diglyceride synthetase
MKAEVTMYQPYPSSGAPAPVLTAVRLMYAGAAASALCLIISLAVAVGDIGAAARGRWLGYSLTTARLGQLKPLIVMVVMAGGLVVIALWLWMARANGQGRNWARILSTVLAGLAGLQLSGGFSQPAVHAVSGVAVLGLLGAVLAWLPGLAAVWLLWRPASSAFFTPRGFAQAGHGA